MTVVGNDGWLFFDKELHHVGTGKFWGDEAAKASRATRSDQADPLPAIVDFKAQMDKARIEIILVPVPPKAVVYPEMVCRKIAAARDGPPRLDVWHQAFYDLLRKEGITVVDLTAELMAHRLDASGPAYCRQDTHWSGVGCVLAAKRIAALVKDRPWLKDIPRLHVTSEWATVDLNGDLWQALPGDRPPREKLALRFVATKANGRLRPVEPDPASPIILLGDSHSLIFHAGEDMQAKGAGLADQLALELGLAVDVIAVRGSGATAARVNLLRQVRADADYLKRKKLVIWCFGAREFTESDGWAKVPVVK
jgi:alginate O-acetyltransferase complex protein AlgJ